MAGNEIIIKIEGLTELTAAINRLASNSPVVLSDAVREIGAATAETATAAPEAEKKIVPLSSAPESASIDEDADEPADVVPDGFKKATKTFYAKRDDGVLVEINPGELMPKRPSDAGWTRITKKDYEAAMENDDAAGVLSEATADPFDEPKDGGPVQTESSADPFDEDEGASAAPAGPTKAEFKQMVVKFNSNDSERERGHALLDHYNVKKLSQIYDIPGAASAVMELIQAAADHFADGDIAAIPESKNSAILKKIGKLPVPDAAADDEDDDF